MSTPLRDSRRVKVAGTIGLAFGILTVFSGGTALFGGDTARAAVGNAVPFVLWFNFLAGFAYILAGLGLLARRKAAVGLSAAIAISTLAILAAFGLHVAGGGLYEMRTFAAMSIRSTVWLCITVIAFRAMPRKDRTAGIQP